MFMSLSTAFSKFGKFHIGWRITKKNALWMSIIMLFVSVFQMTWYMIVLTFWMIYATCYGFIWCIKKIIALIKNSKTEKSMTDTK